jgi:hypothetical protein
MGNFDQQNGNRLSRELMAMAEYGTAENTSPAKSCAPTGRADPRDC